MEINFQSNREWRSVAAARRPRNRFATAPIPRSVFKRPRKPCPNRRNSEGVGMKRVRILLTLAVMVCNLTALSSQVCAAAVNHETTALVGGTVINPVDGKVVPNATVVINGDRIERVSVGEQDAAALGKQIDCAGKFILPGYIDTHIHFFQSGDLFTRPDAADLTSVRPYKDEVAWVKSHVDDVFARYLRCGITCVVDVGGPFWNFEVRK